MSDQRVDKSKIVQGYVSKDIISFKIGQPDPSLFPVDDLKRSADRFFISSSAKINLQYISNKGSLYFRELLADFLSNMGYSISDPENILITAGASGALDLICFSLTEPGDTIFVEDPTYFISKRLFLDHGLNIVSIPVNREGIDIEGLEEKLKNHKGSLLYTIPIYHNPTGYTLSEENRVKLVEICNRYGVRVVADEVYHLLNYTERKMPSLCEYDRYGIVIVINSFSKILAPGLRLGWIECNDKDMIDRIARLGLFVSGGGINPLSSSVIADMVKSGQLKRHIRLLRNVYGERLKIASSLLKKEFGDYIRFDVPEGGFFVWVDFMKKIDWEKFKNGCKKFKVEILPGKLCSLSDRYNNAMRLSISYNSIKNIELGIKRLKKVLEYMLL